MPRTVARMALVLALAAGIAGPVTAAGSTAVYTVGNYPVDAKAADGVTAKATAVADGQKAALRSLLKRIVPVTAYGKLKAMPPLQAADIVEGIAVRSERNSPTQYIATLDFGFQPEAVRAALRRAGIPYVDEQAPPVMVIPMWRRASGDATVESGSGEWFDAWKGLDLTNTLTPVRLEGLKPGLGLDRVKPVLDGKSGTGAVLATEYRTETVVLALVEPDATGKKLIVTMAGQDAVGPFRLQRAYQAAPGDTAYVAELAAVVGLGVLEGRWKALKADTVAPGDLPPWLAAAPGADRGGAGFSGGDGYGAATGGATGGGPAAGGSGIQLVVEFTSLAEWNDIRGRILDAEGAYDMDIGAVSTRSAQVSVRHPGGSQGLSRALARAGLSMNEAGGSWRVRATF